MVLLFEYSIKVTKVIQRTTEVKPWLMPLCNERAIKLWYKIMTNNQSPSYEAYVDQCNNVISTCWAKRINSIIDHIGFANIRINFDYNFNCVLTLKRRLKDQFIQEWGETINLMPKLVTNCKFKNSFLFRGVFE